MERDKRSIALLFAVYFLQGMVFYGPVATLYRQAAGLDLLQIGVIESISMALMLALEVPWGVAADRLGHRRTIVLCAFLLAVSKVLFWRAESFGGFLAERLLLSVAFAGLSGCDSAYLYACCGAGDHRKAFSRWEAVQTAGLLLASLIWPLLGGRYRLAALLTVGTYTAAALLTLGLAEPKGGHEEQIREPLPLRKALRGTLALAPLLLAFCLVSETAQMVTVFLGQLQFLRAGIGQGWFGVLQAAVVVAGLLGGLSHRLSGRLGERRAGTFLMAGAALACLAMAALPLPLLAAAGVVALRGAQSLLAPLSNAIQNDRAAPGGRAAQLSCNAMLLDGGGLWLYPAFGALADRGVEQALLLGGICCAAGAILFCFWMKKPCQPPVDRA